MKIIYFDNASTTDIDIKVKNIINNSFKYYANSFSNHILGFEVNKLINKAKTIIADYLKCKSNEIFFTSGSTQGNIIAIKYLINLNKNISISNLEHPTILKYIKSLKNKTGRKHYKIYYINNNKRGIYNNKNILSNAIINIINNEIGVRQSINIIKRNIYFIDYTQCIGKITINLKRIGIDILSFSTHKIYGPKGIGVIFIRKRIQKEILFYNKDLHILFPGTLPTYQILGLAKTIKIIRKIKSIICLSNLLLFTILSYSEYFINGCIYNKIPDIINFGYIKNNNKFYNIKTAYSKNSTCNSNNISFILRKIKLKKKYINNSVRISFSKYNKIKEIIYFIKTIFY